MEIRTGAGIFGRREGEEEEGKKRGERREKETGVGGDGMTTTIDVTFNSGDRGNLKGEEREERLEIVMTKF